MFFVTLAFYIFLVALVAYYATRIMSILLLLFIYRFWETIFPYKQVMTSFHFTEHWQYITLIFTIAVLTVSIIMWTTKKTKSFRYIILLFVMFYSLRYYSPSDIFFFKDYFQERGMWSLDYWVNQLKELFNSTTDQKAGVIQQAWNSFVGFFEKIWFYIKKS